MQMSNGKRESANGVVGGREFCVFMFFYKQHKKAFSVEYEIKRALLFLFCSVLYHVSSSTNFSIESSMGVIFMQNPVSCLLPI